MHKLATQTTAMHSWLAGKWCGNASTSYSHSDGMVYGIRHKNRER